MATHGRKPGTHHRDRPACRDCHLHAAGPLQHGIHRAEAARNGGVSRQTVSRWQADGTQGLTSRGTPGRTPNLSDAQRAQAEQALLQGAKAHRCETDLWTLDRVAIVIWRLAGLRHHPAQVWRVLPHRPPARSNLHRQVGSTPSAAPLEKVLRTGAERRRSSAVVRAPHQA